MKIRLEEKDDGSVWKRYKTSTGIEVVTTSAFREIMRNGKSNPINSWKDVPNSFLRLLHKYRKSVEWWKYNDGAREYVASGQDAAFYGIADSNIWVREEKNVWPNEDKLDRMDRIQFLLELGSLPRWIKIPVHYGIIKVPNKRQASYDKFIVMEKIDHWVTAFDIIDEPRNDLLRDAIQKEFSGPYNFREIGDSNYELFRAELEIKYREVKDLLKKAFDEHKAQFPGWTFNNLFTDLLQRNLVVTHNEAPIGGSRISFWIIDQ